MTPAVIAAEKAGVNIEIHEYEHDPLATSYGEEAAQKLGVEAGAIFKTLVVETDRHQLAVGIVPVLNSLNIKAMAAALGVKKIQMAEKSKVERSTGYILGGVSPIGQKKKLPTIIDQSAVDFPLVFVSGGRRGLDIALHPNDLVELCSAKLSPIAR